MANPQMKIDGEYVGLGLRKLNDQKAKATKNNIERIAFEIQLTKDKKYEGRLYKCDWQIGCSVSTATSVLVPLYLQNWMKANSAKKIEARKEQTAGMGTELHTIPQAQAEGVTVEPKEEIKEWVEQWEKTKTEYDMTAEYSELPVFSKIFAFGGTIDRVGMFNGKRCVIDFKTGHYSHIDLWKTEAYRQAYVEMTGDVDVGTVVLYLPRPDLMERGQKVRHYTVNRHTSCFLAFLSAYQTFKMLYFKELLAAGMTEKDVFNHCAFDLYEREHGTGAFKD